MSQDDLEHENRMTTVSMEIAFLHRGTSIEIEGFEFGENGLTDRGWESALESARKPLLCAHRRTSLRAPSYKKYPLTPGSPSFSCEKSGENLSDNGSDRISGTDRHSSAPPWLQSNVYRGKDVRGQEMSCQSQRT